jgi:hypothetical protein
VKGFSSALRYKAVDSLQPTWLAIYDLSTPQVIDSDDYRSLRAKASQREFDVVSRLQTLDRRLYTHLSTHEHPAVQLPTKFLLVVSLEPRQDGESEFNKWYEEEHMVLLSKVPGWLRGRRYKFLSQTELAGKATQSNAAVPPPYVAIHEFDRPDFMALPEYQSALNTPWRNRVMSEIVLRREVRVFELHRNFVQNPQ